MKCFYKFSKKCHNHFKAGMLRIVGVFPTCLLYVISYLQIQQTKGNSTSKWLN